MSSVQFVTDESGQKTAVVLPIAEYERMKDGKDIWLNATEMCKRGIATHVMFGGQLITAEDFLKQG